MKNNQTLILNTGGTFNKSYNPINGTLEVPTNNKVLKKILKNSKIQKNLYILKGMIYKDSLDIKQKDRKQLVNTINNTNIKKIIIVHGTDTIDKTAQYVSQNISNKQIVLTASMIPYNINPVEATANFMAAWGYLSATEQNGVYISMHGFVKNYKNIKKNKQAGVFECH